MVRLFERYRIIGSNDIQLLGDLFEQLLNKGFKQNEGQFFTPIPIARFIWDCLPLEESIHKDGGIEYPRIIDYACGAGHFLTEGYEAVEAWIERHELGFDHDRTWVEKRLFGIEKDYRLARVSKISLFMHGAGGGNIVFGDGLDNYPDRGISPAAFDILVSNPPYSVKGFKPHLNITNRLETAELVSADGSEIETVFVERISQLVRPGGMAAVILPQGILFRDNNSYVKARESLLDNFRIAAIVMLGGKTFGATNTSTEIMFLRRYDEPPKRSNLVDDSVDAILSGSVPGEWEDKEIANAWLKTIGVPADVYISFAEEAADMGVLSEHPYFRSYLDAYRSTKRKEDFFVFSKRLERRKLHFFALVYNQTTLVVSAPDDNKAQKEFLGYEWSNRRGKEGIIILKGGGRLYDHTDRESPVPISAFIRASMSGHELPDPPEYCSYIPAATMFDFSGDSFTLRMTPGSKIARDVVGYTKHRLEESCFTMIIGDRMIQDNLQDSGPYPVFSANVFEPMGFTDSPNPKLTDFTVPSILWSIDCDWMVRLMPAGTPFYPTDHCGVLRVTDDSILPAFLREAILSAGNLAGFSRNMRASIKTLKKLTIQIPPVNVQIEMIEKVRQLDARKNELHRKIEDIDDSIKSRFIELFEHSPDAVNWKKTTLEHVCKGITDGSHNPPASGDQSINIMISSKNIHDGLIDYKDPRYLTDSDFIVENKRTNVQKNDLLMTVVGTVGRTAIVKDLPYNLTFQRSVSVIHPDHELINVTFLKASLDRIQPDIEKEAHGSSQKGIYLNQVKELPITIPPLDLQNQFANFVEQVDKSKSAFLSEIKNIDDKRTEIVSKYLEGTLT